MQGYNMERIYFRKKGKFLTLEVPGLAERRPSLVKGDEIYVKLAAEDSNEANRIYQVRFPTYAGLSVVIERNWTT